MVLSFLPTSKPPDWRTPMKRNRRRLPIPQHEFGFVPDTFNLIQETGLDGDRISRERAEADRTRRTAESRQARLFASPKLRTQTLSRFPLRAAMSSV
jgi:aspartate aminotransferase-like enzyme